MPECRVLQLDENPTQGMKDASSPELGIGREPCNRCLGVRDKSGLLLARYRPVPLLEVVERDR